MVKDLATARQQENNPEARIWDDPIAQTLWSKVLGEERSFLVYLPVGYGSQSGALPVVYRLDGEGVEPGDPVPVSAGTGPDTEMPEVIVVSIPNTDRTRDMSPIKTSFCQNPGADRFMDFLSSELIPHIDRSFRVAPFRILCGQSYSAVFTLYVLLDKPSLFNGYIAISLYFPECKEYLMNRAIRALEDETFDDRYLFIARGALDFQYNKDNKTERAIAELLEIVREKDPVGLKWHYEVYEDHGHCPEPSYADGLRWNFMARNCVASQAPGP
jgi:predicted alpha/beta superfamily hydrolase